MAGRLIAIHKTGQVGNYDNRYTYKCDKCFGEVILTPGFFGLSSDGKTCFASYVCSLCEAAEKVPTPKLTTEEIEVRKAAIKERSQ